MQMARLLPLSPVPVTKDPGFIFQVAKAKSKVNDKPIKVLITGCKRTAER